MFEKVKKLKQEIEDLILKKTKLEVELDSLKNELNKLIKENSLPEDITNEQIDKMYEEALKKVEDIKNEFDKEFRDYQN
jgi:galactokinase/mevalonate kinase-like predicted kinase